LLDKGIVSGKIMKMNGIFLLLGTNRGELKTNLLNALEQIKQHKITVIKKSKIYKTKAWGNPKQPDFLNMALEVECSYSPEKLLQILKAIESRMGRKKVKQRWGPRIIDIDILFYGDKIINMEDLIIPHKEFYNRSFAIMPLAEISPDFIPPLSKKKIKDCLAEIDNEGIEIYSD
jgi:2-amino-4-hydroxy-6-hydroxymethyldihydropteridine diphosphokinase